MELEHLKAIAMSVIGTNYLLIDGTPVPVRYEPDAEDWCYPLPCVPRYGTNPLTRALGDIDGFMQAQRTLTWQFNARRRMRHQRRSVTKR